MKFTIRCPVYPTEDSNCIMQSLLAFFPKCTFTLIDGDRKKWFESEFSDIKYLENLRSLIHEFRIIDASKRLITISWTGTMFTFRFDKQVAIRNKINLVDDSESPSLGFIELLAYCESEEVYHSFLNWFTPLTKDGKIVRS